MAALEMSHLRCSKLSNLLVELELEPFHIPTSAPVAQVLCAGRGLDLERVRGPSLEKAMW